MELVGKLGAGPDPELGVDVCQVAGDGALAAQHSGLDPIRVVEAVTTERTER